jgi:magnesium transporter
VIVDAAWYVEGRRILETDSIEKLAAERGGTGFGWLGLRMPSDAELDIARDAFDLPELAIADARHKHDRPKVERHGDCLLTVVPTAWYVDEREEVEFGELFLYAGRDYLLSVRYGQAGAARPRSATSSRSTPSASPAAGRRAAGRPAATSCSPTSR